jgi:hypothetical protein
MLVRRFAAIAIIVAAVAIGYLLDLWGELADFWRLPDD